MANILQPGFLYWDGLKYTVVPNAFTVGLATASGDLSGFYPNPVVVGLQGQPVASNLPVNGQILRFNGTQWAPASSGADTIGSAGQFLLTNSTATGSVWYNLTGDISGSISTPGQLTVVSLTGVSGVVTIPSGTQLKLVQGGTLASPKIETVLTLQPRDPSKSPFQLVLDAATFNSTVDSVMTFGYMGSSSGPEPTAYWAIEQDYNTDGTNHLMEMYWTFNTNPGDGYDTRALYAGWERAGTNPGQTNTYMSFARGGTWQILDAGNSYASILKANATTLTFGETTYTLQGSGTLTLSGGTVGGNSTLNLSGDSITFNDHSNIKWASWVFPATLGSNLVELSVSNAATVGFVLTMGQAATTSAGVPVAVIGQAAGSTAAANTLGGNAIVAGGHYNSITADGSHFGPAVVIGTNGINTTTMLPNIEIARFKQDGNGASYLDMTANGYIAQVKGTDLLFVGTSSFGFYGNTTQVLQGTSSGIQLFSGTVAFGGGVGVLGIANATTNPSGNPVGGAVLYASGGNLWVYPSSGSPFEIQSSSTTFAPGGDLTGNSSAQYIKSISGANDAGGTVAINASTLSFAASGTVLASGGLTIRSTGGSVYYDAESAGASHILRVGASLTVVGQLGATSSDYLALGASPALAGILRVSNNTSINFRNAGNSADFNLIGSDGSNNVNVSSNSAPGTYLYATGNITWVINGISVGDLNSSGFTIRSAITSPSFTQAVAAASATPQSMYFAPQSPATSGNTTSAQNTPGSLIVDLGTPQGAGGTAGNYPGLIVQQSGTGLVQIGAQSASYTGMWFGSGNLGGANTFSFLGKNDGTATYFNVPSNTGTMYFSFANNSVGEWTYNGGLGVTPNITVGQLGPIIGGGSGVLGIANAITPPSSWPGATSGLVLYSTNGGLGVDAAGITFSNFISGPLITQSTAALNTAASNMTIQAQSANSSSTSNINGGSLILQGGNAATGGNNGSVDFAISGTTYAYFGGGTSNPGFYPQTNWVGQLGSISTAWLASIAKTFAVYGNTTDTQPIVAVTYGSATAGSIIWGGGGSSSPDLRLQRTAVNTLQIDNDAGGSATLTNPGTFTISATTQLNFNVNGSPQLLVSGTLITAYDNVVPANDALQSLGTASARWNANFNTVTATSLGGNSSQSTPMSFNSTTISNPTGTITLTAAQYANPIIQLTGTLSTTTIVFPNKAGTWWIWGNGSGTSGSPTITVQASGGTAATAVAYSVGSVFTIITDGSLHIAIK